MRLYLVWGLISDSKEKQGLTVSNRIRACIALQIW